MKNCKNLLFVALMAFFLIGSAGTAAVAGGKGSRCTTVKCDPSSCVPVPCDKCPSACCLMATEGVSFSLSNLSDGVTVKLTSSSPEVVKTMHAHFSGKGECGQACSLTKGLKTSKEVRLKVKNTSNGVKVKVRSPDPETAKAIQTYYTQLSKHRKAHKRIT